MYKNECFSTVSEHLKERKSYGKLISVLSFMLLFSFNISKGYGATDINEELNFRVRTTHATNIAAKEDTNEQIS